MAKTKLSLNPEEKAQLATINQAFGQGNYAAVSQLVRNVTSDSVSPELKNTAVDISRRVEMDQCVWWIGAGVVGFLLILSFFIFK